MRTFQILALCLCLSACGSTRTKPPHVPFAVSQTAPERNRSEAFGHHMAIATEGAQASLAAKAMLAKGGNIIDAAIAASFVISVERPESTGIGGGGFMIYREAKTGKIYAIDFRERGPKKATPGMFLSPSGEVTPQKSVDGILAAGVPGMVDGLVEIHHRFGSLPLSTVLAPAIRLAQNGLRVHPHLADAIEERKDVLKRFPASAKIFLKKDGQPYRVGEILCQRDLAKTLRRIAREGSRGFYEGHVAKAITRESRRLHGLISAADLRDYQVKWDEPVRGTYDGYDLVSMPPPSSGGTHVIEILQILENDKLRNAGALSTKSIHLEASSMQLAFADRASYMGDPAFVKVPTDQLVSKTYAALQRARIDDHRETPSSQIHAGRLPDISPSPESTNTTHLSLMDDEGNVVSSTQTLNWLLGSGVVVPGTGILLNDEMDDFSQKPGASNVFGAIGSVANEVEPGKTPLSSMSPTIVLKNGVPILAIGSPGGTRIITCVAQTLMNYLEFGLPLYDSIAAMRFHHQWLPDQLDIESPGPGSSTTDDLRRMGYHINMSPEAVPCHVLAVAREGTTLHAVSDPRDVGTSVAY